MDYFTQNDGGYFYMVTIVGRKFQNRDIWMLKPSEEKNVSDVKIRSEKKFGLKEDQFILCKNCGIVVTAPKHIITVNDQHSHTFINPAGITYQVGCFSSADGCIIQGEPSMDHTWFAGFSWNYAICSNCHIHLGWYYQNGDESFFGLISDLLDISTTL